MTRSIRGTRRAAVLLAGAAVATTLLVSGCGAGQIAETMLKDSGVPGVNIDSPDHSIQIRNLLVPYKDTKGYPAGGSAPISVAIYNATQSPISVRIRTAPPDRASGDAVISGRSVVLGRGVTATPSATPSAPVSPSGSATVSASPTGSPTASPTGSPTTEPERPAVITIPANGSVIFPVGSREPIEVTGLDKDLVPGKSVSLIFEFEHNGQRQEIRTAAPMGLPLSPAPRGSRGHEEIQGGH